MNKKKYKINDKIPISPNNWKNEDSSVVDTIPELPTNSSIGWYLPNWDIKKDWLAVAYSFQPQNPTPKICVKKVDIPTIWFDERISNSKYKLSGLFIKNNGTAKIIAIVVMKVKNANFLLLIK